MNPISLNTLATAFAWTGWAFGAPSITVLVLYVVHLVRLRLTPVTPAPNFGDNPDALLAILQVFTGAVSLIGKVVGGLLQFLFDGLALLAGVGLVLAIACWCTSHGLRIHATWGRASAGVLIVMALVPVLLLGLSFTGVGRLLMVVLAALCLASLHTVFTGGAAAAA